MKAMKAWMLNVLMALDNVEVITEQEASRRIIATRNIG